MQSYNPGVLGWGFLRLLLHLQLRSLSRGVPSSHLEKDERLILGHICIYSWKRHALRYAVFGFANNRGLNTLYGLPHLPGVPHLHVNSPKESISKNDCEIRSSKVCVLSFVTFSHESICVRWWIVNKIAAPWDEILQVSFIGLIFKEEIKQTEGS